MYAIFRHSHSSGARPCRLMPATPCCGAIWVWLGSPAVDKMDLDGFGCILGLGQTCTRALVSSLDFWIPYRLLFCPYPEAGVHVSKPTVLWLVSGDKKIKTLHDMDTPQVSRGSPSEARLNASASRAVGLF